MPHYPKVVAFDFGCRSLLARWRPARGLVWGCVRSE
jgi:hypothetical protein